MLEAIEFAVQSTVNRGLRKAELKDTQSNPSTKEEKEREEASTRKAQHHLCCFLSSPDFNVYKKSSTSPTQP